MPEKGDLIIVKSTGYSYDESAAVSNYYRGTLYTTISCHLSMLTNYIAPALALRLGIAMVRCLMVENFSAGRDVQKLYLCTILQLHLVRRRCPDLVALGGRAGLERKS